MFYVLHKERAVCIDFRMRKQWESMEGLFMGGAKHISWSVYIVNTE